MNCVNFRIVRFRIVKNYLIWRFVMNRANNLDSRFETAIEEYNRDQYGTQAVSARWKKCVDFANGNLGIAVSALYVKQYFDLESKHMVCIINHSPLGLSGILLNECLQAENMIRNIKNEFMDILDEVQWMDAETRIDAKQKVVSSIESCACFTHKKLSPSSGTDDGGAYRIS